MIALESRRSHGGEWDVHRDWKVGTRDHFFLVMSNCFWAGIIDHMYLCRERAFSFVVEWVNLSG